MNVQSPLSLARLAQLVRLRWRTAAAVAAVAFAASAAYVLSLKPEYTSTAVVLLAPMGEELGYSRERAAAMTDPFFVRSETAILTSEHLAREVVARLGLADKPEFQAQPGLRARWSGRSRSADAQSATGAGALTPGEIREEIAVRRYRERLAVFNDGRSSTVEVSFSSVDPRLAADVANLHAQVYIEQQAARKRRAQREAIGWLAGQVEARAVELREAETRAREYQLGNGLVSAQSGTITEQRLAQLNAQLVDARRKLAAQTTMLEEVRRLRDGHDAGIAARLASDETLAPLLQERVALEARLAAGERRFAPTHPTLVKDRQRLESLNGVLAEQFRRLEEEASSSASWWTRQVAELDAAVAAESARKGTQDRAAAGLPSLLADAQVKRTVFESVLGRYQTLLAESSFASSAAIVASRAMPSSRKSFPRTGLFLLVAAALSAGLGALAAVAVQFRRATAASLAGLSESVGVQPLVTIPRFRERRGGQGIGRIVDPQFFVESIRFLRDAVLEKGRGQGCTVCLITSILPRQGKTLVAMSLARAIARSRHRTLFVEVDLRRPTGSTLARRPRPKQGFAAVLEGRASLDEVLVRDEHTGLDMLLAEEDASIALDRLTGVAMRELLESLRDRYDAIVIDSPPVGIVSDALTMASLADRTVLVAKDGDSSVHDLRRGVRLLRERGACVGGLVLTSVDPRSLSVVDRKILDGYVLGMPDTPRALTAGS